MLAMRERVSRKAAHLQIGIELVERTNFSLAHFVQSVTEMLLFNVFSCLNRMQVEDPAGRTAGAKRW